MLSTKEEMTLRTCIARFSLATLRYSTSDVPSHWSSTPFLSAVTSHWSFVPFLSTAPSHWSSVPLFSAVPQFTSSMAHINIGVVPFSEVC